MVLLFVILDLDDRLATGFLSLLTEYRPILRLFSGFLQLVVLRSVSMFQRHYIVTIFAIVAFASSCKGDDPVKVSEFGPVRVGMQIPDFAAISEAGVSLGPTSPPGRFYLYIVSDRLPQMCLDDECGDDARQVVAKGGHVIGGSDGKHAMAFGVEIVSAQPWKLAPSLVTITDASGRITAIWNGAGREHIGAILHEEGL